MVHFLIYTLSLHDALPIFIAELSSCNLCASNYECTELARCLREFKILLFLNTPIIALAIMSRASANGIGFRSEEHTSELQSHSDLVCRLLLEKKKKR